MGKGEGERLVDAVGCGLVEHAQKGVVEVREQDVGEHLERVVLLLHRARKLVLRRRERLCVSE